MRDFSNVGTVRHQVRGCNKKEIFNSQSKLEQNQPGLSKDNHARLQHGCSELTTGNTP